MTKIYSNNLHILQRKSRTQTRQNQSENRTTKIKDITYTIYLLASDHKDPYRQK